MYDRVLLSTDGSAAATSAIEPAVTLASEFGAELHVLSVLDTAAVGHPFEVEQVDWLDASPSGETTGLRDAAEAAIDDVTTAAETDDIDVVTAIRDGVPHTEIVTYAEANDVDLIVMGSHGRGGIRRMMLGSVTERVIRTSHVQVLVTDMQADS